MIETTLKFVFILHFIIAKLAYLGLKRARKALGFKFIFKNKALSAWTMFVERKKTMAMESVSVYNKWGIIIVIHLTPQKSLSIPAILDSPKLFGAPINAC